MSSTTALVPYPFEGHSIRVSTDQRGEVWITSADPGKQLGISQEMQRGTS
jgi:prophage antirepressor-like protein